MAVAWLWRRGREYGMAPFFFFCPFWMVGGWITGGWRSREHGAATSPLPRSGKRKGACALYAAS